MNNYEVTVSHKWNMIVEAESEEDAKAQALALDEEIPCDDMGTDVEVVELPRVTVLNESRLSGRLASRALRKSVIEARKDA